MPLPFEIYATIKTAKYNELERHLHEIWTDLADKRIRKGREFFNIKPQEAFKHMRRCAPFARTNKKLKRGTSPFFVFFDKQKINYLLASVGICKSCLGNIKSGFFILFLSAIILNKTPRRKKLRAIIHKQSPFLTV